MRRLRRLLAAAVLAAPLALGAARVEAPLTPDQEAAFAARLETAVERRLTMLPAADEPLRLAAGRCKGDVTAMRPRLYREPMPRLIGLPGGRIFISTGLLAAMESDAELASVIAHEAGHVGAGDLLDRLGKAYGTARLKTIAGGAGDDVLSAMAANVAAGGIMTRHGSLDEARAEDAARAAGCDGGLAPVLARAKGQRRLLRQALQAHPLPAPTKDGFPGAADPAVEILQKVLDAAGPAP